MHGSISCSEGRTLEEGGVGKDPPCGGGGWGGGGGCGWVGCVLGWGGG